MTATRITLGVFITSKLIAIALWPWQPLAAIAVFAGFDVFLAWQIIAPSAQGLGRVFTRFATDRREVWLTIDDGPDPDDTPQILALLAHHRATATFFVIGERAARYPHLINAIRAVGHEVAHHTHTHPIYSLWAAGPRRFARELDAGLAALAKQNIAPSRFRTPGGTKSIFQENALAQRGLDSIAWTIRSWDTIFRKPHSIVRRVMRRLTPGSILLFHEGSSAAAGVRVKAIARLLVALDSAGYRCVIPTAAQLREAAAAPPITFAQGWKIIRVSLFAVMVGLMGLLAWKFGWRDLIDQAVAYVQSAGAPLFFGSMAVLPIVGVPLMPFALTAGPAFAPTLGMPLVIALLILCVVVNVSLSYWIGLRVIAPALPWLCRKFGWQLPALGSHTAFMLTVVMRSAPGIPFWVQSYLLAGMRVPFRTYLIVSTLIPAAYLSCIVTLGQALREGRLAAAIAAVVVVFALGTALHFLRLHLTKPKQDSAPPN